MKWALAILLALAACNPPSESYVFRPKKQLNVDCKDLKSAMLSGYWVVEPAELLYWYDFREDNQCTVNWVDVENGAMREAYCIWFLHDNDGTTARLDLVIPVVASSAFTDVLRLDGDVIRLEGKPEILKHSPTIPLTTPDR